MDNRGQPPGDELKILAHDLKNALSVVINYALLIEQEAELSLQAAEDLKEVQASAERSVVIASRISEIANEITGAGT